MTDTRFAHFHAMTTRTDLNGVAHTIKGRLLATVATAELPDGTVAVGISRCNPEDSPVRYIGRHIAKARLDRLVASLTHQPLKPTQEAKLATEREGLLAFRMDKDVFINKIIRDGILRKLALADKDEVDNLSAELRNSTL